MDESRRDILVGFLARLVEGGVGSPSPGTAPLDSCLRRNDVCCFEIIAASVGIACDSFLVFVCSFVSQRRRRRQTVGPPGGVWKICPRHRSVVTLASAVASPARRGG